MYGNGVVNASTYPPHLQPVPQCIALNETDHVLVKYMGRVRTALRQRQRHFRQTGIVAIGDGTPPCVVGRQVPKFDPKSCCLNGVETRIDPDTAADVTVTPA